MPAEGVHLSALGLALAHPSCSPAARRIAAADAQAARLGALLIDLPYFARYAVGVARYALGFAPAASPWGERLHARGPVEAIRHLLAEARARRDLSLAAAAMGLASHASIDRDLHPLVNALARGPAASPGRTHLQSHMEVEKFHSILFHEEVHGKDLMGTSALAAHLEIAPATRLEAHVAGPAWAGALGAAFGEAPAAAEVAAWGRGYAQHVALISSLVGRTIAPPRAKERARPLLCEGAWGRFPDLLGVAVARSVPVLDAVAEAFLAEERDLPAALARLDRLLPPGTIDGPGLEVDLTRPLALSTAEAG